MTLLSGWVNFYVIAGSAAAALIGLQFVALALIAGLPVRKEAGQAFSSPTIVHFGTVLFLSAALAAPWSSLEPACGLCVAGGVFGLVYTASVVRSLREQTIYELERADWVYYAVAPTAAYAVLAASALAAFTRPREALFGVGAAILLLLGLGIHNAWDIVTYHVFTQKGAGK